MRQGGTDRALLGHRVVSGENDEEEGKVARCGEMRQNATTVLHSGNGSSWSRYGAGVDGSGERLMLMKAEVGTLVSKIPYSQTPSCNERGKLWCDVPANLGVLRGPTLTI